MPVHLDRELDLGVLELVDADPVPGQTEQLRKSGAGQGGNREERAVRLVGGDDGLLELVALEDPTARALGRLRTLRGEHQRYGIRSGPAQPSRVIAIIQLTTPMTIIVVDSASPSLS